MKHDGSFLLILGCFVLSGAAGLVYEMVWTQQFVLVFGAAEIALITVLAAYMAGLALGAWSFERLAHFVERPIFTYALLELGIGVAALGVPFAVDVAGRLHVVFTGNETIVPPRAPDLLHRARAGISSGEVRIALASIHEARGFLRRRPALNDDARAILESIRGKTDEGARIEKLLEQLERTKRPSAKRNSLGSR